MKKLFTLILSMVFAVIFFIPCFADVAFEPNDSFYNKHYDECERLYRYYYTNGTDGYVTVWDSPKASSSVDTIPNGNALFISVTYGDGNWGVVEYNVDSNGEYSSYWASGETHTGWVDMSNMVLKYDNGSFIDEFGSQFTEDTQYQKALDGYKVKNAIYFYTYPGSGEINCSLEQIDPEYSELEFSDIYKDDDGNIWGYCGYYMASKGWVCISDPENGSLPMTLDRTPELIPAAAPDGSPEKPGNAIPGYDTKTIVFACIAVAIVVIAVVIYLSKKEKEKQQ